MGIDYKKYSKEELVNYISVLEKQLKSKKYGLCWDKQIDNEAEVFKCNNNMPILNIDKSKSILLNNSHTNVLIEGDNFISLTALNTVINETIDVIYIDPPYNTGHEDFVYNDKYVNSDDGYIHSKWLSFMEKRLKLARTLLKPSGVIFISIDDNELYNLKLLCDSIFGANNFVANLIVTSAPAGTQSSVGFALQQSYCLVYQKTSEYMVEPITLSQEEIDKKYNYGVDELGNYYIERLWKRGIGGRMEDVPSLHFPVYYNEETKEIIIDKEFDNYVAKDKTIKIIPYQTKGVLGRWTWSREKMLTERDHLIVVKVAGEFKLHKKVYSTDDNGRKPYTIIDSKIGRTELGSLELKNIFNGDKVFDYPKFSGLIKFLIGRHPNKNAKVLDFFAGSGTTGQAVLELNKEDNGNRSFILCTNNENNICEEVTYNRLKTVITGIRKDGTKYSDGLPSNLIYMKTDFVKSERNTDQAKYSLVEKVDGLLCIIEDTFIESKRDNSFVQYSNYDKTKHMFIYNDIYNENEFKKFKDLINETTGEVIAYIYSSDNTIDKFILDELSTITIKPIPSKIFEIYKEIIEDVKRG